MLFHGQQPCGVLICVLVYMCEKAPAHTDKFTPELHQLVHKVWISRAKITHCSLFNKYMTVYLEPGRFSFLHINDCRSTGHTFKLITVNGVQMLFCASRVKIKCTQATTYNKELSVCVEDFSKAKLEVLYKAEAR